MKGDEGYKCIEDRIGGQDQGSSITGDDNDPDFQKLKIKWVTGPIAK